MVFSVYLQAILHNLSMFYVAFVRSANVHYVLCKSNLPALTQTQKSVFSVPALKPWEKCPLWDSFNSKYLYSFLHWVSCDLLSDLSGTKTVETTSIIHVQHEQASSERSVL